MGCTKLENESCLKEAIKLIKPSATNGEVAEKVFNKSFDDWYGDDVEHHGMATIGKDYPDIICSSEWFYKKWGE